MCSDDRVCVYVLQLPVVGAPIRSMEAVLLACLGMRGFYTQQSVSVELARALALALQWRGSEGKSKVLAVGRYCARIRWGSC
jgi:hypothetical protein